MSSALNFYPPEYLKKKREEFGQKYEEKLIIIKKNGCHIWNGAVNGRSFDDGRRRYGVVNLTHPVTKKRTCFNAHVFSLFLHNGMLPDRTLKIDISHLCHETLCVNPQHLNQEPHEVNVKRRLCVSKKTCSTHAPYPDCLYIKKVSKLVNW